MQSDNSGPVLENSQGPTGNNGSEERVSVTDFNSLLVKVEDLRKYTLETCNQQHTTIYKLMEKVIALQLKAIDDTDRIDGLNKNFHKLVIKIAAVNLPLLLLLIYYIIKS